MNTKILKVRMLGDVFLEYDGKVIDDTDKRKHMTWTMLEYILLKKERRISQEELINILWADDPGSGNKSGALKTLLHRLRLTLDGLGENAGQEILLFKGGEYFINPDVCLRIDRDDFERLIKLGNVESNTDKKLATYLQALEMYKGNLLKKLDGSPWLALYSSYYANLYKECVLKVASILDEKGESDLICSIVKRAVGIVGDDEDLLIILMQNLLDNGERQEVISIYERLSTELYANFKRTPKKDITALYHEAMSSVNDRIIPDDLLRKQFLEEKVDSGAFVVSYDVFRYLYQAELRQISRTGEPLQVAIFTLRDAAGEMLSRRSLDVVLENFTELLRTNMRSGDILCKCSAAQFAVMLKRADYKGGKVVCERILKQFNRKYPHSPAVVGVSLKSADYMLDQEVRG